MSPFSVHSQRLRKNFARIPQIAGIPKLIEIQNQSYDRFLQMDKAPEDREDIGLQGGISFGVSHKGFFRYRFSGIHQIYTW